MIDDGLSWQNFGLGIGFFQLKVTSWFSQTAASTDAILDETRQLFLAWLGDFRHSLPEFLHRCHGDKPSTDETYCKNSWAPQLPALLQNTGPL
jgi:hypothetical protein